MEEEEDDGPLWQSAKSHKGKKQKDKQQNTKHGRLVQGKGRFCDMCHFYSTLHTNLLVSRWVPDATAPGGFRKDVGSVNKHRRWELLEADGHADAPPVVYAAGQWSGGWVRTGSATAQGSVVIPADDAAADGAVPRVELKPLTKQQAKTRQERHLSRASQEAGWQLEVERLTFNSDLTLLCEDEGVFEAWRAAPTGGRKVVKLEKSEDGAATAAAAAPAPVARNRPQKVKKANPREVLRTILKTHILENKVSWDDVERLVMRKQFAQLERLLGLPRGIGSAVGDAVLVQLTALERTKPQSKDINDDSDTNDDDGARVVGPLNAVFIEEDYVPSYNKMHVGWSEDYHCTHHKRWTKRSAKKIKTHKARRERRDVGNGWVGIEQVLPRGGFEGYYY